MIRVSTALILLSVDPPKPITSPAMAVPVIVIIGREITMSALREWAASASTEAHKVNHVFWILNKIPDLGCEGQFLGEMENSISVL